MRKKVILALGAALILLVAAAPAALAAEQAQKYIPFKPGAQVKHSHVPLSQRQEPAAAGPAAAAAPSMIAATCTVSGIVQNYGGAPLEDAIVELYYWEAGDPYFVDAVTTGPDGAFSFTDVPESAAGELDVFLDDGNAMWREGLVFTSGGTNEFTIRPGLHEVLLDDGDGGASNVHYPYFLVDLFGSGGGAATWLEGPSANALATAPDFEYGVMYPFLNSGIEVSKNPAIVVTPGVTDAGRTSFNELNARDVYMMAPYWASGRPGATTQVMLYNWPAGYRVETSGYSYSPKLAQTRWGAFTTSGSTMKKTRAVPSAAPAGYTYWLTFKRTDSGSELRLDLPYQVATLKSTKSTIYRGGSFRLSGVVPTAGHWGATRGISKTLTLYKRTSSAGQPTAWDATTRGWKKVGYLKANGLGAYVSGYLKPSRTSWYIVRYPGDRDYYRGYTSVIKVTVK